MSVVECIAWAEKHDESPFRASDLLREPGMVVIRDHPFRAAKSNCHLFHDRDRLEAESSELKALR